jgi:hypothetical protein
VRMRDRDETISVIAALAETTESEVRGLLKLASASGGGGAGRDDASARTH